MHGILFSFVILEVVVGVATTHSVCSCVFIVHTHNFCNEHFMQIFLPDNNCSRSGEGWKLNEFYACNATNRAVRWKHT